MQDKVRAAMAGCTRNFGQHFVGVRSAPGDPGGLPPCSGQPVRPEPIHPMRPYKNPVENQGTAATRISPSTSAPR